MENTGLMVLETERKGFRFCTRAVSANLALLLLELVVYNERLETACERYGISTCWSGSSLGLCRSFILVEVLAFRNQGQPFVTAPCSGCMSMTGAG